MRKRVLYELFPYTEVTILNMTPATDTNAQGYFGNAVVGDVAGQVIDRANLHRSNVSAHRITTSRPLNANLLNATAAKNKSRLHVLERAAKKNKESVRVDSEVVKEVIKNKKIQTIQVGLLFSFISYK